MREKRAISLILPTKLDIWSKRYQESAGRSCCRPEWRHFMFPEIKMKELKEVVGNRIDPG